MYFAKNDTLSKGAWLKYSFLVIAGVGITYLIVGFLFLVSNLGDVGEVIINKKLFAVSIESTAGFSYFF